MAESNWLQEAIDAAEAYCAEHPEWFAAATSAWREVEHNSIEAQRGEDE